MHKFKIDSSIIDDFLNHQDIGKYYMDDIYMVGDEEEHSIFMMPLNPDYERIRFIKDKIKVVTIIINTIPIVSVGPLNSGKM